MTAFSQFQESNRRETSDELKPLLILSILGRSGTTLLMQLLGTSAQIAFDRVYPFEVRYLTYLLRWTLLLREEWQPNSNWDPNANFRPPDGQIGPFPYVNTQLWNGQELWPKCLEAAWSEFSQIAIARTRENDKYVQFNHSYAQIYEG